jgi:transcriptional regulator with XRE-family HTH domain
MWYILYHSIGDVIMTFGEFVRIRRLDTGISLREFCTKAEIDPSNWSKIERGILPSPANRELLESLAKLLKLKKGDKDWFTFFDLASISQQKIPDDVYEDENVVSALPVFFRTVRGEKPTEEELDTLIALLKRR